MLSSTPSNSDIGTSTIMNPFSNNKRKVTLRSIFQQKDLLIKYIVIGISFVVFIILLFSIFSKMSQVSKIDSENEELKNQISKLKKSNKDIEAQSAPIRQAINQLKKDNQGLKKKNNDLKNLNKKLKKENKNASADHLQKLEAENEESLKKLKELQDLNAFYQDKYTKLLRDIQEKKDILATLQSKLTSLSQGGIISGGGDVNPSDIDSRIFTDIDEVETLTSLLFSENVKYELLYRASQHGFSPNAFHKRCDEAGYTVTVAALRSGLIICGFTTISWGGEGYGEDRYAALINLNYQRKYKPRVPEKAIYRNPEMFPIFGNGDFMINGDNISSSFPNVYGDDESVLFELLNGKEIDQLVELEVFRVTSA